MCGVLQVRVNVGHLIAVTEETTGGFEPKDSCGLIYIFTGSFGLTSILRVGTGFNVEAEAPFMRLSSIQVRGNGEVSQCDMGRDAENG